VADRVVEQVRHQALDKVCLANRLDVIEHPVDLHAAALCLLLAAMDYVLRELSEVERLPRLDATLAAGERQQSVDQPLLMARQL
jgi:hypothetical protein